jgi:alkaline phosphatase
MARNIRITLIAVIALFALFASLYVRGFVTPKPHGVILFVANGLTPELLAGARAYSDAPSDQLVLDTLPLRGLLRVDSRTDLIPDPTAAMTELATGIKVHNGALGLDSEGERMDLLTYKAQRAGRAVALVTNGSLARPSSAAWFAHGRVPLDPRKQMLQLVDSARLDLVMGGGYRWFPQQPDEVTGRDLIAELRGAGYDIVRTAKDLEDLPAWRTRNVLGLFAEDDLMFRADSEEFLGPMPAPMNQPRLATMVRRAIQCMQYHVGGYFLVVDASLLDTAIAGNHGRRAWTEILELDDAIRAAQSYAGERTLIVVTSGFNRGGPTLSGKITSRLQGDAFLAAALNPPQLTWTSGPGGLNKKVVPAPKTTSGKAPAPTPVRPDPSPTRADQRQPALRGCPTAEITAGDVPLWASGSGSELLIGTHTKRTVAEVLSSQF